MMRVVIGEIAKQTETLPPTILAEHLHTMFNEQPSLEGVVIAENDKPVGIIMKGKFFQKLSMKYGFDLFMQRSIDLLMDETMMVVDYYTPITEVGQVAMDREQDRLYDYVIVERYGQFYGIVSIRELIIRLSEVQIEVAKFSNPLSGLPGNRLINATIEAAIRKKEEFTVLYLDLDNFKVFNDLYGFTEGDSLLVETAHIIRNVAGTEKTHFVGHIGGDDFVVVLPHYNYKPICEEIIQRFDQSVIRFYPKEDYERGYIQTKNRQGIMDNVPIVSISIAVIPNRDIELSTLEQLGKESAIVKAECKAVPRSVYLEKSSEYETKSI